MTSARLSASAASSSDPRCYRLTAKGRACVAVVETEVQTLGSLSRYLHDVLLMCGTGIWFDQLRQFMPPRTLDESLQALLTLGLIECLPAPEPARAGPPPLRGTGAPPTFGQMVFA